MREPELPGTLLQAVRYFSNLDVATEFFAQLRWPDGPVWPRCGGRGHYYLAARRLWKCKSCKRQFSAKVGSIFEDSPLGLDKWRPAVWLTANTKNGISSHELARSLGITQKSAWFMLHRILLAMRTGSFAKFDGTAEMDETYIGGEVANMHQSVRDRQQTGAGTSARPPSKEPGTVRRAQFTPRLSEKTHLAANEARWVEPGSTAYTDDSRACYGLSPKFDHSSVRHGSEYVRGQIHTNGIENFWSLLKRGLHGTYVSVDPAHLFRYVDERLFAYNLQDLSDLGRFTILLGNVAGNRLTYTELRSQ